MMALIAATLAEEAAVEAAVATALTDGDAGGDDAEMVVALASAAALVSSTDAVLVDGLDGGDQNQREWHVHKRLGPGQWQPPLDLATAEAVPARVVAALRDQPHYEQGTWQWGAARHWKVSASDVASALCMGYAPPPGRGGGAPPVAQHRRSETMLLRKARFVADFEGNAATRRGHALEPEALRARMAQVPDDERESMLHVGLLAHRAHPWLGASPDAIGARSGRLVEIKCPATRAFREDNRVAPPQYWPQMQLQLEVTALDDCAYFDYKPAATRRHRGRLRPEQTNTVHVARDAAWFAAALPVLRVFAEHMYRLHALAAIYRPAPWRRAAAAHGLDSVAPPPDAFSAPAPIRALDALAPLLAAARAAELDARCAC